MQAYKRLCYQTWRVTGMFPLTGFPTFLKQQSISWNHIPKENRNICIDRSTRTLWNSLKQSPWVWCHTLWMPTLGDIRIFFPADPLELSHTGHRILCQASSNPFPPDCTVRSDSQLWQESCLFQTSSMSNGWRPWRSFTIHYDHFYYYTAAVLLCSTCIICLTLCCCCSLYGLIGSVGLSLCWSSVSRLCSSLQLCVRCHTLILEFPLHCWLGSHSIITGRCYVEMS